MRFVFLILAVLLPGISFGSGGLACIPMAPFQKIFGSHVAFDGTDHAGSHLVVVSKADGGRWMAFMVGRFGPDGSKCAVPVASGKVGWEKIPGLPI